MTRPHRAPAAKGVRPAVISEPRPPQDPAVARLDELLDGDDEAAALAQAKTMVGSSSAEVRAAAVDALRWLGGLEAATELAKLLADTDPDVAQEAADGVLSVLDDVDDPAAAATLLEQAILSTGSPDAAEAFCLRLSGLAEETSVPVLLNLLEGGTARQKELAREYLEFVTGGEPITNRAEGEAWLREHQAEGDAEGN